MGPEFFFDAKQLVVLGHAVTAAGGTRFDLAGGKTNCQVRDEGILGLAAAMAGDRRVSVASCQLNRFDRFGQCADLIDLDQDTVGDAFIDAALQALDVGYEQVVANKLHFGTQGFGQQLPAFPIVFRATVFDRADGILRSPVGEEANHVGTGQLLAIDGVGLGLGIVELGGSDVERDEDLFACGVTGLRDGFHDQVERFLVAAEVGSKAAFVAHGRVELAAAEHFLQVMEDFDAGPQAVAERLKAERHDHELLHIDRVVGVLSTVDDVHHRCWKDMRTCATEVTIQWQLNACRSGFGGCQRNTEQRVGPQAALVRCTV